MMSLLVVRSRQKSGYGFLHSACFYQILDAAKNNTPFLRAVHTNSI